jgi:hypothetical protein
VANACGLVGVFAFARAYWRADNNWLFVSLISFWMWGVFLLVWAIKT